MVDFNFPVWTWKTEKHGTVKNKIIEEIKSY